MGRSRIVKLLVIGTLISVNVAIAQKDKPIFEKYGDSLSIILNTEEDVIKASRFIKRIDSVIDNQSIKGLGVYYYYKSMYLKRVSDDKYENLLLKTLKVLQDDNNVIYEILTNQQLSILFRERKDFITELFYLSNAFKLCTEYKEKVPLVISDIILRSYFSSLFSNNKADQAIHDAKWINQLTDVDKTKVLCLFNVSYLMSQKGAFRDEIIINEKLYQLIRNKSDLNSFFIPIIFSYSESLKASGLQYEGHKIYANNISKIEQEFSLEQKCDFYLRFAKYNKYNEENLNSLLAILNESRFKKVFMKHPYLEDEFENLSKDTSTRNLKSHEDEIKIIINSNIHETRLIEPYSFLSIEYHKTNEVDKSTKVLGQLKLIFQRNKNNLSELELQNFLRAAIYFEDIQLALETWSYILKWINRSICLNYSFTQEEFDAFYKIQRSIVFSATSFNLKYGNFPELQKRILEFHELMKRRIYQEIEFNKKLKSLDFKSLYQAEIKEYNDLNENLIISDIDNKRLLGLKRYLSKSMDLPINKFCKNIDIDRYINSERTILYYTTIKIDGADFYRLYVLNKDSDLTPVKFYRELEDKRDKRLNSQFAKSQLQYLESLNLSKDEEIFISRSSDVNFVNFSAFNDEINNLTGTQTKIRHINSLNDIDHITDEKFSKDTEIILFGDIDFDNYVGKESTFINNNKASNQLATNLSRSYLNYWTYLPGTLKEMRLIKNLAENKNLSAISYDGVKASEENLRQLTGNQKPYILHLATHGYFFSKLEHDAVPNSYVSNDNPLIRSGIVLAGANRIWQKNSNHLSINDGVLTSKEVSDLDLSSCKLLVLSACETGLGEFGTDSVDGLQKAFKIAGVDKMIMSLSKIPDDKTPIFFEYFYKELFTGMTIHNAFSKTQNEMKKRYGFEDDFWASFVLLE